MAAAYGVSLNEVLDGDAPWPAEARLIATCQAGESAFIGVERPEAPSDENRVRAALIRN